MWPRRPGIPAGNMPTTVFTDRLRQLWGTVGMQHADYIVHWQAHAALGHRKQATFRLQCSLTYSGSSGARRHATCWLHCSRTGSCSFGAPQAGNIPTTVFTDRLMQAVAPQACNMPTTLFTDRLRRLCGTASRQHADYSVHWHTHAALEQCKQATCRRQC